MVHLIIATLFAITLANSAYASEYLTRIEGAVGYQPNASFFAVTYSSNDAEAEITIGKEKFKGVREGAVVHASHFIKGTMNEKIDVYLDPFKGISKVGKDFTFGIPGTASGIMCEAQKDLVLVVTADKGTYPSFDCISTKPSSSP